MRHTRKEKLMTAVAFAEAMDVNYTTVMRWLRNGLVPGAERIEPVPGMKVWQIPESALEMKPPKPGPPRGTKKNGVKKAIKKISPKK
jgi:hypothetical protein